MLKKEPVGFVSLITSSLGWIGTTLYSCFSDFDIPALKELFFEMQFQYQVILLFSSYYICSKIFQAAWEICTYLYYKFYRKTL